MFLHMKTSPIIFIGIIVATSISSYLYAFESTRFINFTAEDGLAGNNVRAITQDAEGFIWIGTQSGLSHFDGYQFKNYYHTLGNLSSLSSDDISAVITDAKSNVWIGTVSGGLNKLNSITGSISHYTHKKNNPNSISSNLIHYLHLDSNQKLYIATNKGLDSLDLMNEKIEHIELTTDIASFLFITDILSVKNDLWIATRSAIYIYNKINKNINIIKPITREKNNQGKNIIYDLFQDDNEKIWIATNKGLSHINPITMKISHFALPSASSEANIIKSITEDSKSQLWVATAFDGIFQINSERTAYKQYYSNPYLNNTLNKNSISKLFIDENNVLWAISNIGLNKLSLRSELFGLHRHLPNQNKLSNNPIRGFQEDSYGYLWIRQDKLRRYDPKTGNYDEPFISIENYNKKIFSNFMANAGNNENNIWLASKNNEIVNYNIIRNSIKYYSIKNFQNDGLLSKDSSLIRGLFYDKNLNLLWLNTNNELYQFYEGKYKLIPVTFLPNNMQHTHHGYINEIYTDKKNFTWLGTYFGLFQLKEGKVLNHFKNNHNNNLGISHDAIYSLVGDNNALWIGTQNGLNKYNYNTGLFSLITTKNGLADNHIRSMLLDQNNNLWVSTNRGLSRINLTNNIITNFNKNDGLQSEVFGISSMLARKNGQLVFGGDKGFNLFNPDDIKKAQIKDIQISELHLFNKKIYLANLQTKNKEQNITDPNTIVLDHKQNDLSITLSAVDYHDPMSILYRYKLEGFNDTWISRDAKNRTASFTNLDHGTYTLKAQATYDPNNYWSPEKNLLTIIVLPPWWQTLYAYITYVLIAIALIYGLIRLQTYRLKRKAIELESIVNQRTKQIQNQKSLIERLLNKKNEMFAYISHEFRTPLTLISGPIADLKNRSKNKEDLQILNIAQRNTERMSSLVNQLLDLSQAYQLENQSKTPQHISQIAQQLSSSFQAIADNKQIHFTTSITPDLWTGAVERSVESILTNLLANAFKYTNNGGEVFLKVFMENQTITICVKDSGIGIPEDKLQSIFEQFTRLEDINRDKIEGTGLGLALVKQLVDMHHWEISVNSKIHEGSEFIVSLPADSDSIKNNTDNKPILSAEAIHQINYLDHLLAPESDTVMINSEPVLVDANESLKLLIIDDTEDMVLYLQGLLSVDYHCLLAHNGETGLDLAIKEAPDLVICDVMMPGISGFEVLDKLRSQLDTSHIPVLLLTAKGDKESRIKGLSKLADDYIAKPFDGDELKARIKAILSLRKLRQKRVLNHVLQNDEERKIENSVQLTPQDKVFIDKWQTIIEKNYCNPSLTVEELAGYMAMSSRRLLTKVKSLLGKGPKEFLDEYRIRKAKELLKNQALSIGEISERIGFDSSAYFSKRFKEIMGVSPRGYRKGE